LARRAGFFTLDSSQRFTGMTGRAIDVKRGAVL
jgi:hypothetical protein